MFNFKRFFKKKNKKVILCDCNIKIVDVMKIINNNFDINSNKDIHQALKYLFSASSSIMTEVFKKE